MTQVLCHSLTYFKVPTQKDHHVNRQQASHHSHQQCNRVKEDVSSPTHGDHSLHAKLQRRKTMGYVGDAKSPQCYPQRR